MKNTTKYAIIIILTTCALLCGPKACQFYFEKKNDVKSKQEQSKLADQDAKYAEYIKDSVLNANGFNRNNDFSSLIQDTESQIKDLCWQNTPGGALERTVFSAGEQIIKRNMDILVMDMAKYGLEIKNIIEMTNDMCKNPEIVMYGAYQDIDAMDENDVHDYFVSQIIKNIDMTSISEIQYKDIVQLVDTDFTTMLSELYISRKNIEKSFAPYIAGGQECINYCAIYSDQGLHYPGYDNSINSPFFTTVKEVKVYDSKLDTCFFGEEGAKYKLEHISQNTWRVSKKQKNGNTVTTPVFKHNVDYKTNIRIEKTKSLDAFTFYPGKNLGVHVYDCKVIDIKTAKKKFKQSKKINNQIDSLNLRRDSLIKKQEEYIKVYNRADTIAKIKLKQRVMARTCSK